MRSLLSHRILETLTLNRDAPFPSEIHDAKEMICAWRESQRLRLVRDIHRGDSDGSGDSVDDGTLLEE